MSFFSTRSGDFSDTAPTSTAANASAAALHRVRTMSASVYAVYTYNTGSFGSPMVQSLGQMPVRGDESRSVATVLTTCFPYVPRLPVCDKYIINATPLPVVIIAAKAFSFSVGFFDFSPT